MKPLQGVVPGIAAFILFADLPAVARDRAVIGLTCAEQSVALRYDCRITLKNKRSGAPVPGAKITVKPDMPTMPGAHNIRAVTAAAGNRPGSYGFSMKLDMYGVWALKITVTGPLRDIAVRKIEFVRR